MKVGDAVLMHKSTQLFFVERYVLSMVICVAYQEKQNKKEENITHVHKSLYYTGTPVDVSIYTYIHYLCAIAYCIYTCMQYCPPR